VLTIYPKHHFRHFVNTIVEAIIAGGGIVKLSTPIEHIQVDEGTIESIIADGKVYQASYGYISDLDPKLTVELMHDSEALSKRERQRLTNYEYFSSRFKSFGIYYRVT
jgi:phytoene dehydrogenase-like protein